MAGWMASSSGPLGGAGCTTVQVRPESALSSKCTRQRGTESALSVLLPLTMRPLGSRTGLFLMGPRIPSGRRVGAVQDRPPSCDAIHMPHQRAGLGPTLRSEEHTSELQSRFGISYAVFCLK